VSSVRLQAKGITRALPRCAPGTLVNFFCRPHETRKHTVQVEDQPQHRRLLALSLSRSLALSLSRSLALSLSRQSALSLSRSLARALSRSLARALSRSLYRAASVLLSPQGPVHRVHLLHPPPPAPSSSPPPPPHAMRSEPWDTFRPNFMKLRKLFQRAFLCSASPRTDTPLNGPRPVLL